MTSTDSQSVYVDQFYEMNPEFEDLIFGADLRDGMVVLAEDSLHRGDPARAFSNDGVTAKYEMARVRVNNRWCTVENLTVTPRTDAGPLVRFIAVYGDGTKRVRQYDASWAWLVKKESM